MVLQSRRGTTGTRAPERTGQSGESDAGRNGVAPAGSDRAAGANVKLANREGATPLWLAAENGSARMIGKVKTPTFFTAMPSASVGPPHGWSPPCKAFQIEG